MPLSWNEIRHNAIRFSREWKHAALDAAVDKCYRAAPLAPTAKKAARKRSK